MKQTKSESNYIANSRKSKTVLELCSILNIARLSFDTIVAFPSKLVSLTQNQYQNITNLERILIILALFYFSESWILNTVFWILCSANMVSGNKILILINVVHAVLALQFLIACYQISCRVKNLKWSALLKKYYFKKRQNVMQ